MAGEKGKFSNWILDMRIRDRMIASGSLDPAYVEQHLNDLPDLEAQAVAIDVAQPALGAPNESSPVMGSDSKEDGDDTEHETASV